MNFLRNSYATRGGKIDPWGVFYILLNGVVEPPEDPRNTSRLGQGLPVWSEKLVPHARADLLVRVGATTVSVLNSTRIVVEEIPHSEFATVDVLTSFVHENGYLETSISRKKSGSWFKDYLRALDQAAQGEKPCQLDNSAFTRVDPSFAGQELVKIESGPSKEKVYAVYTKDGELVPSFTHRPLLYSKWEPQSPFAQYSKSEFI